MDAGTWSAMVPWGRLGYCKRLFLLSHGDETLSRKTNVAICCKEIRSSQDALGGPAMTGENDGLSPPGDFSLLEIQLAADKAKLGPGRWRRGITFSACLLYRELHARVNWWRLNQGVTDETSAHLCDLKICAICVGETDGIARIDRGLMNAAGRVLLSAFPTRNIDGLGGDSMSNFLTAADLGAPRRRFRDQLKDTLLRCAVDQDSWEHLAEDRAKWRRTVMQGTAHMEDQRRAEAEAKRQQRKERLFCPRTPPTLPCSSSGDPRLRTKQLNSDHVPSVLQRSGKIDVSVNTRQPPGWRVDQGRRTRREGAEIELGVPPSVPNVTGEQAAGVTIRCNRFTQR
ncbi:hypothetical protein Bbelb_236320 [Branchiostoma belcheri]|nr:hypothetical protein Bbelb_236320 [Branchiostoma belcheri]